MTEDVKARDAANTKQAGQTKMQYILPAAALLIFVLFALIGSIVSLGNQLMSVSTILGAVYYLFIAACALAGIVYPIVRTLSYPVFGLWRLTSGNDYRQRKFAKRLADNMAQRAQLPEAEHTELAHIHDWSPERLAQAYKSALTPVLNDTIKQAAKSSFIITAISQSSAVDMLSVLSVNLHLVQDQVRACGFRPTLVSMGALYARVLKTTLIAGGLEDLDYSEIISLMGGNSALEAGGMLLSSVSQGMANAFFTARVGVITQAFLLSEQEPDMRQLRRSSYAQALRFLKSCGIIEDVRDAAVRQAKKAVHAAGEKLSTAKDRTVERSTQAFDNARERGMQVVDNAKERSTQAFDTAKERGSQVVERSTQKLKRRGRLP